MILGCFIQGFRILLTYFENSFYTYFITFLEFSKDHKTLFLTPQHPGLFNGIRKDMAHEEREFLIKTTDGKEFKQIRRVPIGSNWPSKKVNDPPKPSLVSVRRKDNQIII